MSYIYRVQVRAQALGQIFLNNLWYRQQDGGDTPLSSGDLLLLTQNIGDRWGTQIVQDLPEAYSVVAYVGQAFSGWEYVPVPPGEEPTKKRLINTLNRLYIPAVTHVGLYVGEMLPFTVATTINLITDRAGRRRRGRIKLGPCAKAQSTGNQMTTSRYDELKDSMDNMILTTTVGGGAITMEPVVFSQTGLFEETAPGNIWGQAAPITNHVINLTWGTQRTRKYNVDPR